MGLDIGFDRAAAIAAGLQLSINKNGTEEDIDWAKQDETVDQDYIDWLNKEEEFIHVPDTPILVRNDGVGGAIVMRANQWGRVYEPMTQWLVANQLQWSEF